MSDPLTPDESRWSAKDAADAERLFSDWGPDGPSRPVQLLAGAVLEIKILNIEGERWRMRLAACGVVALADTPESAKKAREMHADYRSASLGDVERRVDECIALRSEVALLRADLAARTSEKDAANMDAGKWLASATALEEVLRSFPGHESEFLWLLWIEKKDAALSALSGRGKEA